MYVYVRAHVYACVKKEKKLKPLPTCSIYMQGFLKNFYGENVQGLYYGKLVVSLQAS